MPRIKLLSWFRDKSMRAVIGRAKRASTIDNGVMPVLELLINELPKLTFRDNAHFISARHRRVALKCPNVDWLILDLRQSIMDIEKNSGVDRGEFNSRPLRTITYEMVMRSTGGTAVAPKAAVDLLVPELKSLHDKLGVLIASDDDMSSYYVRTTSAYRSELFRVLDLFLTISDQYHSNLPYTPE